MMTFTTASATAEPLTIDAIREAVGHLQALGEEPIRRYMREKGFDPDKGGRLVLPESMREKFSSMFGPPWYVKFSKIIEKDGFMFIDPLGARHDINEVKP